MRGGMAHLLHLILLAGVVAGAAADISTQQEGLDGDWEAILNRPLTSDVVKFTNGTQLQLFPATASEGGFVHEQVHVVNGTTRRMLGDFRQCSPCTCCDRTRRWCLPTVCCYNIRCGLRGLPYGLCSFIPISCTCFGCRD